MFCRAVSSSYKCLSSSSGAIRLISAANLCTYSGFDPLDPRHTAILEAICSTDASPAYHSLFSSAIYTVTSVGT